MKITPLFLLPLLVSCTVEPSGTGGVTIKPAEDAQIPQVRDLVAIQDGQPATSPAKCTAALEGGITTDVTPETHYSFIPDRPVGVLTQRADIFGAMSFDSQDLGYGVKNENVQLLFWSVDHDCAVWYQVRFRESRVEGWTPAYNVNVPGWAEFF